MSRKLSELPDAELDKRIAEVRQQLTMLTHRQGKRMWACFFVAAFVLFEMVATYWWVFPSYSMNSTELTLGCFFGVALALGYMFLSRHHIGQQLEASLEGNSGPIPRWTKPDVAFLVLSVSVLMLSLLDSIKHFARYF